ncbi:hypothetical protein [Peribacillus glennii]|uniref:Core-binding (CB) domain-containing protein n=1 Tax=Peribacillus glennii TaxID=2303991 RepID=A0A372L695_9BACI|nr:hypothetical protein [Peribacillus glennii]RFU60532.1 hypothetical protein D0466_21140 [Peribacillus glennii]
MRKNSVQRKFKREGNAKIIHHEGMTMAEMFEQFMFLKTAEGLSRRTIKEYYVHYDYFMRYAEQN